MKPAHYILSIICLVLFITCGQKNQDDAAAVKDSTTTTAKTSKRATADPRLIGGEKDSAQVVLDNALENMETADDPILGNWVGSFGKNKINLILSKHAGNSVEGFSVCAGNYRPVKGSIVRSTDNSYDMVLNEPGDDKYDGKFEFTLDVKQKRIDGEWTPFKQEGNSRKSYELFCKTYTYSTTNGDYPKASQELLTEADVENMNGDELELMRNEIYARHGYSFKNKTMRYYFEEKDWYIPMGIDVRHKLTDTEVKNIELIYRYEEYYKINYDNYGR